MKTPSFSFAGRTALVTGASRGIGQAISLALAQAGATVIVAAREVSSLEETRALITAGGGQVSAQALDVADTGSIARCFAAIGKPLDILVNNAGTE